MKKREAKVLIGLLQEKCVNRIVEHGAKKHFQNLLKKGPTKNGYIKVNFLFH